MSRTRRINRVTAKRAETPTQDSTPADHPETPEQPAETPVATPEEEQVQTPVRAPSSGSGVTPSTADSDVNVEYEKKAAKSQDPVLIPIPLSDVAQSQEAEDDSHSETDDPGG